MYMYKRARAHRNPGACGPPDPFLQLDLPISVLSVGPLKSAWLCANVGCFDICLVVRLPWPPFVYRGRA